MKKLGVAVALFFLSAISCFALGPSTANGRDAYFCRNFIRDLAPTIWFDFNDPRTTSLTGSLVDSITDKSGNGRTLTAATTGRPALTRTDNLENRVAYSEDITQSPWSAGTNISKSAQQFLETAATGYHYVSQAPACAAGVLNIYSADVKSIGGRNVAIGDNNNYAVIDLSNGTQAAVVGTASTQISSLGDGWYHVDVLATPAAVGNGIFVYSAAGTSISFAGDVSKGVACKRFQVKSSAADVAYLQTTATSQFRGILGRSAAHFDGIDDVMTSTATLSQIISASAYTIIESFRPGADVTNQQYLRTDTAAEVASPVYFSAGNLNLGNDDTGGARDFATVAVTAGTWYTAIEQHSGGKLRIALSGGGSNEVDSGNTVTLTGTLVLGRHGTLAQRYLQGDYLALLAFNRALLTSDIATIVACIDDPVGLKEGIACYDGPPGGCLPPPGHH